MPEFHSQTGTQFPELSPSSVGSILSSDKLPSSDFSASSIRPSRQANINDNVNPIVAYKSQNKVLASVTKSLPDNGVKGLITNDVEIKQKLTNTNAEFQISKAVESATGNKPTYQPTSNDMSATEAMRMALGDEGATFPENAQKIGQVPRPKGPR